MLSFCRRYRKCFIWAVCVLTAAFGLILLSRSGAGFAQWYAVHLFPLFPNTIGRLLSPLPFSVYEFVLYALVLGLFVLFSWCWRGICFAAGQRQKGCYPAFSDGCFGQCPRYF